MGSPSVNIQVNTEIAGLRAQMQSAGAVIRSSADDMVSAGTKAQAAWKQYAEATVAANEATQAVKGTLKAISTGEVPLTTRVVNDLAVAQMEAAQAARQLAAAQREMKAATAESNTQMASGVQQATLFSNVLGMRLGRGLEQVISRTPMLAAGMNAVFPVVTAIAFAELAEHIGEQLSKWISDVAIFTKEMQAAYAAELAFNKQLEDEAGKQKQFQREIFEQTHSQSQVKRQDLQDEKKHQDDINAALLANKAAQTETGRKVVQEAITPTRNVITGVVAAPGVASPETIAQAQKLRTEAELLNAQLATSKLRVQDLTNGFKEASDQENKNASAAAAQAERALEQQAAVQVKLKEAGLGNLVSAMPGGDVTAHYKADLGQIASIVQAAHAGALQEMDHFNSEWLKKRADAENKELEDAKKAAEQLRQVSDIKVAGTRNTQLGDVQYQEQQVRGQHSLGAIDEGQELEQLRLLHEKELQIEREYIAAKILIDQADEKALAQDINEQAKIEQKGRMQALQDDQAHLQQRLAAVKQWSTQVSGEMFSGVNSWMMRQKSFTQSMKAEWNSVAMSTLRPIEQIGEKWVATHVLMRAASAVFHAFDIGQHTAAAATKTAIDAGVTATQHAEQITQAATTSITNELAAQSYAALAAVAALASTAAIPVVGPALAPGVAAGILGIGEGFATMAAFDEGGVVPKTQVALVHSGERVLDRSDNESFERAMAVGRNVSSTSSSTSSAIHYHDHTQVSAMDGAGVGRVLRRNRGKVFKEVARAARLQNLGSLT